MRTGKTIHEIGIICKSCHNQWSLSIPLSGNHVEAFAAICDCGVLIVGNFNLRLHEKLEKNIQMEETELKKIYLTNGHFDILDLDQEEISSLPSLSTE